MSLKHATFSAGIVSSIYGMTLAPLFFEDFLFKTVTVEVYHTKQRAPVTFVSFPKVEAKKLEVKKETKPEDSKVVDSTLNQNSDVENSLVAADNHNGDIAGEEKAESSDSSAVEEDELDKIVTVEEDNSEKDVEEKHAVGDDCTLSDKTQLMFISSISQVEINSWHVDRDMVEFYAVNPLKLKKLAGTWTYKIDNRKIGFRVRPTECSILFDAGFKSDDVVTSINGTRVSTLYEAIKAYFVLRGQSVFSVDMLRDGENITQVYTMDKTKKELRRERRERKRDDRKERRRLKGDADGVADSESR